MNRRLIVNYVGLILIIESVLMAPALIIALFKSERASAFAFAVTMFVLLLFGIVFIKLKAWNKRIYAKEGFVIVALSWIFMSVFGCLPFYLSGEIPSIVDSFFETVSGFTTTGCTILTNIEILPMSLLYWRSFTHWLGGLGVLVFMLAIVPLSEGSSLRIMRAESPGPVVGKLVPKIRHTARILYIIYIALTVIETIMLLCGGMPLFDSVVHAFGTAGTGGFSIKNAGIGAYDSNYLQTVISVFMLLFGVNFNVYYLILTKNFKSAFKSSELKLYVGMIVFCTVTIAINTLSYFDTVREALHHSLFQVAAIITTTGYSTTDFNLWPQYSRVLLLLLMTIGACAGSTGGGTKVARLLMVFKSVRNYLQKMLHPRSVKLIKIDGKVTAESTINEVFVFYIAFALISAVSIILVSFENFDFDTTISSVVSCMGNIGPGLSMVGPVGNFSQFSDFSKLIFCVDMLFGRLEVFPMLILFSPSLWRRGK